MQNWKYVYGNYTIEVKNTMLKCELYINGEMVDDHKGLDFGANLIGDLDNGEKVLASLHSGVTSVSCDLYIVKGKITKISKK